MTESAGVHVAPSIERARAEGVELSVRGWFRLRDLLRETPTSERRTGVLRLHVRTRIRTINMQTDCASQSAIAAMPRKAPPDDGALEARTLRVYRELVDPDPLECTHCGTPGYVVGTVCVNCDGTRIAQRVKFDAIVDRVDECFFVLVPQMSLVLQTPVRAALTTVRPPDAIRIELARRALAGPYRETARTSPTICGFPLDEVAGEAQASIDRARGEGDHPQRVECHALPVLVLGYDGAQAVLLNDMHGKLVGHAVKT